MRREGRLHPATRGEQRLRVRVPINVDVCRQFESRLGHFNTFAHVLIDTSTSPSVINGRHQKPADSCRFIYAVKRQESAVRPPKPLQFYYIIVNSFPSSYELRFNGDKCQYFHFFFQSLSVNTTSLSDPPCHYILHVHAECLQGLALKILSP